MQSAVETTSSDAEEEARARLDKQLKEQDQWMMREKHRIVLIYVFMFVFIGIPIWLKTTQVYRANLPYGKIDALFGQLLPLPLSVKLIALNENDKKTAYLIKDELERTSPLLNIANRVQLRFVYTVGSSSSYLKADDQRQVDYPFDAVDINGSVDVVLSRESAALECRLPPRLYVRVNDRVSVADVSAEIATLLSDTFLNRRRIEAFVRQEFRQVNSSQVGDTVNALRPEYALEVFVVDPRPNSSTLYEQLEFPRLQTFLDQLSPVTRVSLTSQMLYYIDFPMAAAFNKSSAIHYYTHDALPHLINPMESYMGSYATSRPVIRLLLYVTPDNVRPLHILRPDLRPAKHNGFVVKGWGGVVLINDMSQGKRTELAMIALLRQYLGLDFGKSVTPAKVAPLCPWELQLLMYQSCVDNALTSARTLTTLTNLLSRIGNIVIGDEVAGTVRSSVDALQATHDALQRAGQLQAAVQQAGQAYARSERAFFDHSLLELLYFPEDQKYAIYVPLFLPLCFPVIVSAFRLVKFYINKR